MAQITQIDHRWKVSGDVVIATAHDILKASQSFKMSQTTTVDFADVTDIDTTAVSLILEWKRRATRENQSLTVINLPANLTSLVQLYDVAALIN